MATILHSFSATSTVFLQNNFCPTAVPRRKNQRLTVLFSASNFCSLNPLITTLDKSALAFAEAICDDELWAAAWLRVRSFYEFRSSFGMDDHKIYLAQREFEALKERVSGKSNFSKKVSCINVNLPFSYLPIPLDSLCNVCKILIDGVDSVVVGTLDLNQCIRLPDEIIGKKPEGIGADLGRAYLSNVCVAEELHQNGLGYALVAKSEKIAQEWGITDLYVHVAVDNEAAKKLYRKSGFIFENDERSCEARLLDRPRRILLWKAIPRINFSKKLQAPSFWRRLREFNKMPCNVVYQ